jgi:hypothetical protein
VTAGAKLLMRFITQTVDVKHAWHTRKQYMTKKKDLIRLALNQKGIPITQGIPEHVVLLLKQYGYKIKKDKK